MSLCKCGCGLEAGIWAVSDYKRGRLKGSEKQYVRGHQPRHVKNMRLQRTHCRHGHLLPEVGLLECPRCHAMAEQRRRSGSIDRTRAYSRKMAQKYALRSFGMTAEDYEVMAAKQAGRCAICFHFPPIINGSARLHVDHDHVTGAVRGLLCTLCNLALGKMGDDPERLRRAAIYLETAQTSFKLKAV